jgi:hypothetical protein
MNALHSTLSALFAAAALAGSGGSARAEALGGPGESCTRRADCQDGLACFQQMCVAMPAIALSSAPTAAHGAGVLDGRSLALDRPADLGGTRFAASLVGGPGFLLGDGFEDLAFAARAGGRLSLLFGNADLGVEPGAILGDGAVFSLGVSGGYSIPLGGSFSLPLRAGYAMAVGGRMLPGASAEVGLAFKTRGFKLEVTLPTAWYFTPGDNDHVMVSNLNLSFAYVTDAF